MGKNKIVKYVGIGLLSFGLGYIVIYPKFQQIKMNRDIERFMSTAINKATNMIDGKPMETEYHQPVIPDRKMSRKQLREIKKNLNQILVDIISSDIEKKVYDIEGDKVVIHLNNNYALVTEGKMSLTSLSGMDNNIKERIQSSLYYEVGLAQEIEYDKIVTITKISKEGEVKSYKVRVADK